MGDDQQNAREPLAPFAPRERNAEPWAPAAPDLDYVEVGAAAALRAYWGERWPEVSEHLSEFTLRHVEQLGRGRGEELGDPQAVLDRLVPILLARLDAGEAPRHLKALCRPNPDPFEQRRVFRRIHDEAVRRASDEPAPFGADTDGLELEPVDTSVYRERVEGAVAPLRSLYAELDAALRVAIRRELDGLDRHTQPELGTLTVNPFGTFGPPMNDSVDWGERWVIGLTASLENTMKNKFWVQWWVDLRDDPACAAIVRSIEIVEAEVRSELDAVEFELAEALQ